MIETRLASEPLIPFKELTKPLRIANNIVLLFSASLFPMWFVSSLYLQQVLGLSPLHTGLIFLPMTLMIMLVASRTGKLVSHFGVRAGARWRADHADRPECCCSRKSDPAAARSCTS